MSLSFGKSAPFLGISALFHILIYKGKYSDNDNPILKTSVQWWIQGEKLTDWNCAARVRVGYM